MDERELRDLLAKAEAMRQKHEELAAEHRALMRQMEELLAKRKVIKDGMHAELRDPTSPDL